MTEFKSLKFTGTDLVKMVYTTILLCTAWYDLKHELITYNDEFKTEQVLTTEKRVFLQYQIDELKKCCLTKSSFAEAILPNRVRIENE